MRVLTSTRRLGSAGLGAVAAVLAMLASIALPGVHGWMVERHHAWGDRTDQAAAAPVDEPVAGEEDSCCTCEHGCPAPQPGGPPHRHDHRSCEVCRLIDLLPSGAELRWEPGEAWWVHEASGRAPVGEVRRAVEGVPVLVLARGPPGGAAS